MRDSAQLVTKICLLLLLFDVINAAEIYTSLYWDFRNPIFKGVASQNVLPSSSLNILCPNEALVPDTVQNNVPKEQLYENMWIVDQPSYDACAVNTGISSNRRILSCDTPLTLKRYLLVFQQFSAIASGLEFQPGQTYYFIATSDGSKVSLGATSNGHCSTHNMKMSIYVCLDSSDPKCQSGVSVTTPVPTTSAPTTTAAPPTYASQSDMEFVKNQSKLLPLIHQETNKIPDIVTALQDLKIQLDVLKEMVANFTTKNTCTAQAPTTPTPVPVRESCKAHKAAGVSTSGVYRVDPGNLGNPFEVYCQQTIDSGGWAVFQRRFDGKTNFSQPWKEYQAGFGNLSGEFWLGLDKIHRLTNPSATLRVDLTAIDGEKRYAKFDGFKIGNAADKYTLTAGTFTGGGAGDSLSFSDGSKFSTYDQDNDDWTTQAQHCAKYFKGAWWHKACHESSLNGLYRYGSHPSHFADGIIWKSWKGYMYSYKETRMMVKN